MRKKVIGALVLGVMAAAAIATDVAAQAPAAPATPAEAVKARKDFMNGLWTNYYRGFVQVARGESTDLAAVSDKAQEAAAAVRRIPSLFPAGSGPDVVPGTRAKPEVWSQRAEFEAAAAKLADETAKLGDIAKGGNLDATKAQVAVVGQACAGCHGGPAKSGGKFRTEEP
jgi:cytochrome c556